MILELHFAKYVFVHDGTGQVLCEYRDEADCIRNVLSLMPAHHGMTEKSAKWLLRLGMIQHPIGKWLRITHATPSLTGLAASLTGDTTHG